METTIRVKRSDEPTPATQQPAAAAQTLRLYEEERSSTPTFLSRLFGGEEVVPADLNGSFVGSATAVAQKVVLYEEDPAYPNGKRFVGSAIWRTATVTPAPGQPPELAIRADVKVPERKLAVTWSLRRNTDKDLAATHIFEIMFTLPADFPAGGTLNVPGILMKQAEQTRGVPMTGAG